MKKIYTLIAFLFITSRCYWKFWITRFAWYKRVAWSYRTIRYSGSAGSRRCYRSPRCVKDIYLSGNYHSWFFYTHIRYQKVSTSSFYYCFEIKMVVTYRSTGISWRTRFSRCTGSVRTSGCIRRTRCCWCYWHYRSVDFLKALVSVYIIKRFNIFSWLHMASFIFTRLLLDFTWLQNYDFDLHLTSFDFVNWHYVTYLTCTWFHIISPHLTSLNLHLTTLNFFIDFTWLHMNSPSFTWLH